VKFQIIQIQEKDARIRTYFRYKLLSPETGYSFVSENGRIRLLKLICITETRLLDWEVFGPILDHETFRRMFWTHIYEYLFVWCTEFKPDPIRSKLDSIKLVIQGICTTL
jgi:hypothetical protein